MWNTFTHTKNTPLSVKHYWKRKRMQVHWYIYNFKGFKTKYCKDINYSRFSYIFNFTLTKVSINFSFSLLFLFEIENLAWNLHGNANGQGQEANIFLTKDKTVEHTTKLQQLRSWCQHKDSRTSATEESPENTHIWASGLIL